MNYFLKRLREPSTYAGLAAIVGGAGGLAKIDEAPAIADALVSGAPIIAADPLIGGLMVLAGLLATLLKDRGND
ncbi:MAG: hypothetical protein H5U25_05555 [Oceanibaculum nanhaiense]|nr:hypothetical protein [Oceanibaculum nanhaiense]